MAKKTAPVTDVTTETATDVALVYTPEKREQALQRKIKADVKQLPVVDAKLAKLKADYAKLTIVDISDKKGYEAVKKGISELTKYRTATDDKRKEITKDYKDVVSGINDEAARIIEELREIEKPLRDKKQQYEEDLAAEKARIEQEKKQKLEDRVNQLKEAGLSWDGSFYAIGNISLDLVSIEKMPDDKFLLLNSKVADEVKRLADEEAERERIREEERVKLEKQKQEAEAERIRLEQERETLRQQKEAQEAEIAKLKADADKLKADAEAQRLKALAEIEQLKKEAQEKTAKLEREKIEAKAALIGYKLEEIGLRRVGDHYTYHDNVINASVNFDIKDAVKFQTDEDVTAQVETLKLALKRVQDARSTHDKEVERKRKELADQKAEADRKLAEQKEAARKAALPDVEKIDLYIGGVLSANLQSPLGKISNKTMEASLKIAQEKINTILTDLKKSLEIFTK